ncbi:MAG: hypothetical protein CFH37_01602 [Alphaproteobacteria bacterium MarineAlpha9_Bin7]|nr:MAG: hypothetical protein CFH37_01602 [Alphaproteobacteria bacterium MarineAlpha9_Bin7]
MLDNARQLEDDIKRQSAVLEDIRTVIGKVIVGQEYMIERLLVGLLANGHVLIEGAPGLAKTLAVTTLAQALHAEFHRIQFTPDLLPADLVGTLIYEPKSGDFRVRKGPIFANVVLADEINRAPAKVQSALLEAMQENQTTIGEESFPLPQPFLVLATQNPLEQDGTYPLPEAQMDRFMLKLRITYPNKEEELEIMNRVAKTKVVNSAEPVVSTDDIIAARAAVDSIYIDEKLKRYIVDIVHCSRDPETYDLDIKKYIDYGASPRASIYLAIAGKAYAFMQGRNHVVPHDIKTIGHDILRHRIITTYQAEAEGVVSEDLIDQIFETLPVP